MHTPQTVRTLRQCQVSLLMALGLARVCGLGTDRVGCGRHDLPVKGPQPGTVLQRLSLSCVSPSGLRRAAAGARFSVPIPVSRSRHSLTFTVLQGNSSFVLENGSDSSCSLYTHSLELPNPLAVGECDDPLRKYRYLYKFSSLGGNAPTDSV